MRDVSHVKARMLAVVAIALSGVCSAMAAGSVAERRAAVLAAARQGDKGIPALSAALKDENALVRRAAIRALAEAGAPAEKTLRAALSNPDPVVRRAALLALVERLGSQSLSLIDAALKDPEELVRQTAVNQAVMMQPRTKEVVRVLEVAQKDTSPSVSGPAKRALWPFFKETRLLRNRADYRDVVSRIKVVKRIRLPADHWSFKLDKEENGHLKNWFDPELDDSKWAQISIEKFWQKSGYEYEGVAWYRRTIDLPEKPDLTAVEMHFGAVDEMTWLWINGRYVGQHDIGPLGWDKAFALDVTDALQWGKPNQITVRVLNTLAAGGIWKPVTIEVLKFE